MRLAAWTAIKNLEASLADNGPRALIQMATGSAGIAGPRLYIMCRQ